MEWGGGGGGEVGVVEWGEVVGGGSGVWWGRWWAEQCIVSCNRNKDRLPLPPPA
jgi:hypothetical protein